MGETCLKQLQYGRRVSHVVDAQNMRGLVHVLKGLVHVLILPSGSR
jgi:hypothetical protein